MWKKDEAMPTSQQSTPRTPTSEPSASAGSVMKKDVATIGRSITIKGEVSGDEDLLIQGRVDGSVDLKLQAVTVGEEGKVNADITGRIVTVEGEVEGDLRAQEQIILRASAQVKGDITAPRVVLEDGASFRGLVDMGDPSPPETRSSSHSDQKHGGSSKSSGSPADLTKASGGNGASGSDKKKDGSSAKKVEGAIS